MRVYFHRALNVLRNEDSVRAQLSWITIGCLLGRSVSLLAPQKARLRVFIIIIFAVGALIYKRMLIQKQATQRRPPQRPIVPPAVPETPAPVAGECQSSNTISTTEILSMPRDHSLAAICGRSPEGYLLAPRFKRGDAPPHHLLCPITLDIMKDPVSMQDGRSYEREAIQKWYDDGHRTCPMNPSRTLDNPKTHGTHRFLKQLIEDYHQSQ